MGFLLSLYIKIANPTLLSVSIHRIMAGYRHFQVVMLADVSSLRNLVCVSASGRTAQLWTELFMSSFFLDRCCELQQDPISFSRERREKLRMMLVVQDVDIYD